MFKIRLRRRAPYKRADLFKRRIIITIRPWQALAVAAAIVLAAYRSIAVVYSITALVLCIAALATILMARWELAYVRAHMHRSLNAIEDDDVPLSDVTPVTLKKVNNAATRIGGLSKS